MPRDKWIDYRKKYNTAYPEVWEEPQGRLERRLNETGLIVPNTSLVSPKQNLPATREGIVYMGHQEPYNKTGLPSTEVEGRPTKNMGWLQVEPQPLLPGDVAKQMDKHKRIKFPREPFSSYRTEKYFGTTKYAENPDTFVAGKPVYLFSLSRLSVESQPVWQSKRLKWEEYIEQRTDLIRKMEEDYRVEGYVFTQDPFFKQKLMDEEALSKERNKTIGKIGSRIRSQLNVRFDKGYGIGPNIPPRTKMSWDLVGEKKDPNDGGLPPMHFDEYNPEPMINLDELEQRKPLGYQDKSPFGRLTVPYRPVGNKFLRRMHPKPLFKPPMVMKI